MHTTKPHKIVSFQAFAITRVELIKNSCAINIFELHYCTTGQMERRNKPFVWRHVWEMIVCLSSKQDHNEI